jgi:hypothetical protein
MDMSCIKESEYLPFINWKDSETNPQSPLLRLNKLPKIHTLSTRSRNCKRNAKSAPGHGLTVHLRGTLYVLVIAFAF